MEIIQSTKKLTARYSIEEWKETLHYFLSTTLSVNRLSELEIHLELIGISELVQKKTGDLPFNLCKGCLSKQQILKSVLLINAITAACQRQQKKLVSLIREVIEPDVDFLLGSTICLKSYPILFTYLSSCQLFTFY